MRIVSATNRNLKEEIANSNFRNFVFPLVRFHLHLPPLRERREDIPELAAAFLKFFAAKMGKQVKGFAADCQAWMQSYAWPGNVRELRNVIERALIICDDYITLDDMPLDFRSSTLSLPRLPTVTIYNRGESGVSSYPVIQYRRAGPRRPGF